MPHLIISDAPIIVLGSLDHLGGLQIPDPPGNGQLQELAHKTHELLLDGNRNFFTRTWFLNTLAELEERRRGFEKLQTAYKALTDEFCTEEGPNHFDQWGKDTKPSLLRIDSLAAEVATAESIAERLAVETREKEVRP